MHVIKSACACCDEVRVWFDMCLEIRHLREFLYPSSTEEASFMIGHSGDCFDLLSSTGPWNSLPGHPHHGSEPSGVAHGESQSASSAEGASQRCGPPAKKLDAGDLPSKTYCKRPPNAPQKVLRSPSKNAWWHKKVPFRGDLSRSSRQAADLFGLRHASALGR